MNILENRLKEIQEKNNPNVFKHRMKKVIKNGSGILGTGSFFFQKFNFNNNWCSKKIEAEKFTNHIKSCNTKHYEILRDIFKKLYYDNYSFLEEFELDEYIPSRYSENGKRLGRIIKKFNNISDMNNIPVIHEFKPTRTQRKKDKRFDTLRLFVSKNDTTGVIDLYLVDIYHLGINALNKKTNRDDSNRYYNSTKDYEENISKVYEEL